LAGVSQEQRGDRGHARVEDRRGLGSGLERHDLVLEDLGVRVGEARVDEVDAFARLGMGPAGTMAKARSAASGLVKT
jgi:hypothetical protein